MLITQASCAIWRYDELQQGDVLELAKVVSVGACTVIFTCKVLSNQRFPVLNILPPPWSIWWNILVSSRPVSWIQWLVLIWLAFFTLKYCAGSGSSKQIMNWHVSISSIEDLFVSSETSRRVSKSNYFHFPPEDVTLRHFRYVRAVPCSPTLNLTLSSAQIGLIWVVRIPTGVPLVDTSDWTIALNCWKISFVVSRRSSVLIGHVKN